MMRKMNFVMMMVLMGLILTSCGGEEQEKQDPLRPVKYIQVERLGDTQQRAFSGTAKSSTEAKLSFRTSGLMETLSVQLGDSVRRGQLIARLNPRDAQLGLQQARAQLENARVQRDNAASNLERVRQLYEVGNASLSEYEQAKAQASNAESQLESARKNVDLKQSQLNYNTITAPASGVISKVSAQVNETVQAGSPIVTLNSGKGIEIEVGIPESYIARIEQGEKVTVRFSSVPDSNYTGTATKVSVAPGESSTYPVTVTLDDTPANIRTGMAAEVVFTFALPGQQNQMVVPVDAVDKQGTSSYVFVLNNQQGDTYKATKTEVQLGELTEGGFVVKSGLNAGEYIASAGISSLYDGREVTLLKSKN